MVRQSGEAKPQTFVGSLEDLKLHQVENGFTIVEKEVDKNKNWPKSANICILCLNNGK